MSYGYYDYDNYERRRYLEGLARENYERGLHNEPCAYPHAEIQFTLDLLERVQVYGAYDAGREQRQLNDTFSRINDNLLNPILPPRKKNDNW